jgi:hypothetical protein
MAARLVMFTLLHFPLPYPWLERDIADGEFVTAYPRAVAELAIQPTHQPQSFVLEPLKRMLRLYLRHIKPCTRHTSEGSALSARQVKYGPCSIKGKCEYQPSFFSPLTRRRRGHLKCGLNVPCRELIKTPTQSGHHPPRVQTWSCC